MRQAGELASEFHYRLPARWGGQRPGSHHGTSLGAGQGFAAHRRLFDHADPRRIDLRASLRDVRGEWLVRIQRQRVAVPVHAVVDVSASMHFGGQRSKLQGVADFVEALGHSAFRAGDAVGLLAFDHAVRDDLFAPARLSRGAGLAMAQALRSCEAESTFQQDTSHERTAQALANPVARLAGRAGLVFLVSDFHWPLEPLCEVLQQLTTACVVPMVVWDPAETEPPAAHTLLALSDAETGQRRTLWMREPVRRQWTEAVAARRQRLQALFEAHGMAPFFLGGHFDAEALTRHFMETVV